MDRGAWRAIVHGIAKSWNGLPCPPPGCLPNSGIEPTSPAVTTLQVDSLPLSHQRSPHITQTVRVFTLVICKGGFVTGHF